MVEKHEETFLEAETPSGFQESAEDFPETETSADAKTVNTESFSETETSADAQEFSGAETSQEIEAPTDAHWPTDAEAAATTETLPEAETPQDIASLPSDAADENEIQTAVANPLPGAESQTASTGQPNPENDESDRPSSSSLTTRSTILRPRASGSNPRTSQRISWASN